MTEFFVVGALVIGAGSAFLRVRVLSLVFLLSPLFSFSAVDYVQTYLGTMRRPGAEMLMHEQISWMPLFVCFQYVPTLLTLIGVGLCQAVLQRRKKPE